MKSYFTVWQTLKYDGMFRGSWYKHGCPIALGLSHTIIYQGYISKVAINRKFTNHPAVVVVFSEKIHIHMNVAKVSQFKNHLL